MSKAPALMCVRRECIGPQGQLKGTMATNPSEIDEIVKGAWGRVYQGAKGDTRERTRAFTKKYGQHLYRSEEYRLPPLKGSELMKVCRKHKETAGGIDGWTPADFKLLSPKAFDKLAALLNCIEGGAKWPVARV